MDFKFSLQSCLFLLFITLFSFTVNAQNGKITGIVKDETNEALPGVTIRVEGTDKGSISQVDGSYSIELIAGIYSITFNYLGFDTKKITDIQVDAKSVTNLDIVLKEAKSKTTLNEVLVTASYKQASVEGLYSKQKNSSAISDGISSDQIKRTPDNNAAQILKRVSGLTIQDSKFVTVRGMSDRYNNVMLNGSSLPSTEPNRKNFSFDILPSNLIDNVVVNKTATPDLPAEFSGGIVQVQTKDIPDKSYTTFSLSSGINTISINQSFLSVKRSNSEFYGQVGEDRNWWNGKWNDKQYGQYFVAKDWKNLGLSSSKIPNNWGLYSYDYSPIQSYQLAIGRTRDLKNEAKLGFVGSITYRHDEAKIDEDIRFRISDYRLNGATYELNTTGAVLFNIAYQTKKSKISFKNLYNRKLNHTTEILSGTILSALNRADAYTDILTINSLIQNKFEGEHVLTSKRIKVNWNVDRSNLSRLQPDMRNSILVNKSYALSEASGSFSLSFGGLSLMNASLGETRYNYGINVTYPFKLFDQEQKLKFGYQGLYRSSEYLFNGLKLQYTPKSTVLDEIYDRPDYFIADSKYIGEYGLVYRPSGPSFSNDPEGYQGVQKLHAVYVMTDMKLSQKLRFIGGVRMEKNIMEVTTANTAYKNGQIETKNELITYDNLDFLPSINLVYNLTQKSNLRFAYSKTLARPDFRERSPFIYYDFYEYTPYFGVAGLKDTKIDNVDLRYEIYPNAGEIFSASVFYKKFVNPVELIQQVVSGGALNFYFNLASSVNYGIETDWRKSLGFIKPSSKWLKNVYFNGNASYLISNVEFDVARLVAVSSGLNPDSIGNSDQKRKRPLQGLSPYILNAGLGYQGDVWGIQLSYNRFGPRLVTGAPYAFQDQFENSRDVIDLQLNGRFFKNKLDVKLNISDILQQAFIVYQNAGNTPDYQAEIIDNKDPKGTNFNPDKDAVRYKAFKGSNISLVLSWQL